MQTVSLNTLQAFTRGGLEVRAWDLDGELQIEVSGTYEEGEHPFAVDEKIKKIMDDHPDFPEIFQVMHTGTDPRTRERMNGFVLRKTA